MNASERQKKMIVSRLTGEPDVTYLKKAIDGKVAIIRYKGKEIIIQKIGNHFKMFNRLKEDYNYYNSMIGYETIEDAIEYAKEQIKERGLNYA